jgi:lipopolysaccharide biosynthesis regulator YciM
MTSDKKCIRCKKPIHSDDFCQNCKNILLPYFEQTQDWNLAYDMEFANERMARYKLDNELNDFYC